MRAAILTLCLMACLAVMLAGCGGGDPPDDRKADPSPNCAMRPDSCK